MKVLDIFNIKGRGRVITVKVDDSKWPYGVKKLRRIKDGAIWEIKGIERHCSGFPPSFSDIVGLVLNEADPEIGDEIEFYHYYLI